MTVPVSELLSDTYASYRRTLIEEHALQPEAGEPVGSGTVYLATADEAGNMVSFIQSNYMGFGSGIVVPETELLCKTAVTIFQWTLITITVLLRTKNVSYHYSRFSD